MNRGNFQKTPLGPSLNRIARARVADAVQIAGKALPCSVVRVRGQIVTVKFEVQSSFTLPQVTIPIIGAEYLRMPTQLGDRGGVMPFDAYMGGISGLGGGVADLTTRGNLTALMFVPVGSTSFFAVDPSVATLYGPNGVTLQDKAANCVVKITPTLFSVAVAGHTLLINSGGVYLDGGLYSGHLHENAGGSGNSGPVVPGT